MSTCLKSPSMILKITEMAQGEHWECWEWHLICCPARQFTSGCTTCGHWNSGEISGKGSPCWEKLRPGRRWWVLRSGDAEDYCSRMMSDLETFLYRCCLRQLFVGKIMIVRVSKNHLDSLHGRHINISTQEGWREKDRKKFSYACIHTRQLRYL